VTSLLDTRGPPPIRQRAAGTQERCTRSSASIPFPTSLAGINYCFWHFPVFKAGYISLFDWSIVKRPFHRSREL